jgi:hypothetical protein
MPREGKKLIKYTPRDFGGQIILAHLKYITPHPASPLYPPGSTPGGRRARRAFKPLITLSTYNINANHLELCAAAMPARLCAAASYISSSFLDSSLRPLA